jgi:DNA-nicking Smr family endonuclease
VTRRPTSADERKEFEAAFAETRPLRKLKSTPPATAKRKPATMPGLDGNTADRLRKGAADPEAKLDLHGFTEAAAHRALLTFLKSGRARGLRLVLVVTGRGARRDAHAPFDLGFDRGPRGVLKTAVPRWLNEPEFSGLVVGAKAAHIRHGGEGALYIYLRKKAR